MDLRAVLFDINGTLIDIETDEGSEEIYRALSRFLEYQGLDIDRRELCDGYFQLVRDHLAASAQEHADIDVVAIWGELLRRYGAEKAIAPEQLAQLPLFLAQMQRALSRRRLQLYPEVLPVLEQLGTQYRLAIVSDHQSAYALPELNRLGLTRLFHPIVISGEHGFRKPDPRLFQMALDGVKARPDQALYVGNDLYHDIAGARGAGMKSVLFCSGHKAIDPFSSPADYVIYHFGELPQAIEFLIGQ